MKKTIVIAFIIGLFGIVSTSLADCCKIGIDKRPSSTPLEPPTNSIPDITIPDGEEISPVPIPGGGGNDTDDFTGELGLFREPRQHALVAWNGKEQMLFLTTNEQSVVGSRPMISMMPLPGAPIVIKESDKDIIKRAYNLVQKKILEHPDHGNIGGILDVVYTTEIGVHKIFVWKIDNVETLRNDINQFIAKTYGKEYSALISKEGYAVIKQYIDRGFQYFAFDLVKVDGRAEKSKVTILYHYKSNFAYYPVAISQVGGTGITSIVLTMISPAGFNKIGVSLGGMDADTLSKVRQGGVDVDLSLGDLRTIDPSLANLFANAGKAKARIFEFTGNIDGKNKNNLPGLNKDVILYSE